MTLDSMNERTLRILHVIPSLSLRHGGPSSALPLMERALRAAGSEVTVATTDDDGPGARIGVSLGCPLAVNGACRYYFRKQTEFYKYSFPLARWLDTHVAEFDVIHVHALFSHASVAGARAAWRHRIPYVVRPLGVLNRYGMERRRALLKHLSFRWVELPILKRAAQIHYTSQQEKLEAEALGRFAEGMVLPLGIDIDAFQGPLDIVPFLKRWPQAVDQKVILFLSRLDPKKGLEILIEAVAEMKKVDSRVLLVVAGAGEREYVASLERLVEQRGLVPDVLWTGHLSGEMKRSALGLAGVFVLPSESENFGLAAVEALAAGAPTILTRGVGISADVEKAKAGLVVDRNPSALAKAILTVLSDSAIAGLLSANGRAFSRERFSLQVMGLGLHELYGRALEVGVRAA